MSRGLFGTDGIRGRVGEYPLTGSGAFQVGKAIGIHFAEEPDGQLIKIGFDTRESSTTLAGGLAAGIMAVGIDVELLGVAPTPAVSYLTKNSEAVAGVVVTASHNPYKDNGIKIFSAEGGKLPDNTEEELNKLIASPIANRGKGRPYHGQGRLSAYEDHLVTLAGGSLEGLRAAIDTANGATSFIAPRLFHKLGVEVVLLFCEPNGRNINEGCGAASTEALQAVVRKRVKKNRLDFGVAFDGDGDRMMLVDARGRLLDGNHVLYIAALTRNEPGVVGTTMINTGLKRALADHGIAFHETKVGDRYVLEEMERTSLNLGGEPSGHIIFRDIMPTGDGMAATIETNRQAELSSKTLEDWYDSLTLLPQCLLGITVTDKQAVLNNPDVKERIEELRQRLGDDGRVDVRASGTEPLIRVMVEAEGAEELAQTLKKEIEALAA